MLERKGRQATTRVPGARAQGKTNWQTGQNCERKRVVLRGCASIGLKGPHVSLHLIQLVVVRFLDDGIHKARRSQVDEKAKVPKCNGSNGSMGNALRVSSEGVEDRWGNVNVDNEWDIEGLDS
ncbi:uncharacterized protein EI90DRAFT_3018217 [Cantharellus anzutake]|uniref:uncharacterized protein n=1 Tax=Cantharellus anzutake TaxID=1750568 RepID=UPI001903EE75|nr:uncharacterized protein EI90DRAFT_3018217 [Cantharellus anzutake]KAF8327484.1 hypothetical protein EI90DRAFT_3018217 [Cantharellus anzutake]